MTITVERSTEAAGGKDPRGLVAVEVFDLLVADIIKGSHVTQQYAERLMGQALVFLKAQANIMRAFDTNPGEWTRIVPSVPVDEGWHAFIKRSQPYLAFGEEHAGRYIHHVPVLDQDILSGAALARTVPALHATGYHVDMEFWDNEGAGCCPPECSSPGGG
ncbi:hypothetical protein J4573_36130 [Actinomadura barringtoniae]|uniref:Uncharacterized protein n=1 Tax=Actinomadura barringtoniae TaxID=1427535 RepID=A0A939PHW3_9ACTN|nr:hypothetical protein [Actinomadura barringtoniae]MBO2452567.1 hypothetical protein [Actinomadura barringtoniae]